jgi:hypothetical protein
MSGPLRCAEPSDEVLILSPTRPPWLTVFLFFLPYAVGLLLLLGAILWGLTQSTSSEVRAVAGALAIWLGETVAGATYLLIRFVHLEQDPDGFMAMVRRTLARHRTPILVARSLVPGLWIGLNSRNPAAMAVVTRLAISLILFLNSLRVPSGERDRIPVRDYLRTFSTDSALTLLGALIGALLQQWR